MNLLFLGPQGSGKGTQARLLSQKFNFAYFESGSFLRELAERNEELRKSLAEGNLVPDAEMASYVTSYLDEKGLYDGVIFDGFPRTLPQYEVFKKWLDEKEVSLDLVVVLNLSREKSVERLSARRMDPATGRIFNLVTDPPPAGLNKETLIQREDDKPEAIEKRLSWYKNQVLPFISVLKKDVPVVEIDGDRPIDAIFKDLTVEIEKRWKK